MCVTGCENVALGPKMQLFFKTALVCSLVWSTLLYNHPMIRAQCLTIYSEAMVNETSLSSTLPISLDNNYCKDCEFTIASKLTLGVSCLLLWVEGALSKRERERQTVAELGRRSCGVLGSKCMGFATLSSNCWVEQQGCTKKDGSEE